jgi:hypothetical protein
LHIRWQGGAIETVELRLSPNRAEAVRYPDAFVAHIRALAATHHDDEIVALLNRDGLKSSTGRCFTVSMIRWIRHKHSHSKPAMRGQIGSKGRSGSKGGQGGDRGGNRRSLRKWVSFSTRPPPLAAATISKMPLKPPRPSSTDSAGVLHSERQTLIEYDAVALERVR